MKKGVIAIAVLLVTMLSFSSCNKNKAKLLIKKWTIEKVEILRIDCSDGLAGETFDFKKDHTYTVSAAKDAKNSVKLFDIIGREGKWEMDDKGTWLKLGNVRFDITDENDFTRLHLKNVGLHIVLK